MTLTDLRWASSARGPSAAARPPSSYDLLPSARCVWRRGSRGELPIEADELLRLKDVTGFAKLSEDVEYAAPAELRRRSQIRHQYPREQPDEPVVPL